MIERREAERLVAREPAEQAADADRAAAFRRLAEQHLDASYRLARAILHDPIEAQDAVHDAFVRAWQHWGTLRDPSRFDPWFSRIVVNTYRNRLRLRGRTAVIDISSVVEAAAAGDPFAASNDRQQLGLALARLDVGLRVIVALRFSEDLTIDDIATRLAIPAGTAKSRLHQETLAIS